MRLSHSKEYEVLAGYEAQQTDFTVSGEVAESTRQAMYCTYKEKFRHVRLSTVAVEKQ
jgi:hypothetical protein